MAEGEEEEEEGVGRGRRGKVDAEVLDVARSWERASLPHAVKRDRKTWANHWEQWCYDLDEWKQVRGRRFEPIKTGSGCGKVFFLYLDFEELGRKAYEERLCKLYKQ